MMIFLLTLLTACDKSADSAADSAVDTAPPSGDTDTGGATGDSGDSAPDTAIDTAIDTAPPDDSGDSGDSGCPPTAWYADSDGDGWGDTDSVVEDCEAPEDYVADPGDCDDGDPGVHPGAAEICDGADNDCDAGTPEDGLVTLGGANYAAIQDAIDAAADGDTVWICPGTYAETLDIRDALTLEGVGGAGVTTVDAGEPFPAASTVYIQGPGATLKGLTITGGTGTNNDGDTWGGGVYAGQSDGVTLVECVIEGNSAGFAGGVVGTGQYPDADLIQDTIIRDNQATEGGGGFLFFNATLEGVEVTGNQAPIGGGGMAWYWEVSADAATVLYDNTASELGGGLMIWDEGQWYGGEITGNYAEFAGGGVVLADDGALYDSLITDNTAAEAGGGLAFVDARGTVSGAEIRGNQAPVGGGLAVDASQATVEGISVLENVADGYGGGAWMQDSVLESIDSDWGEGKTDNSPDDVVMELGPSTVTWDAGAGASFVCSALTRTCE
jgi:hypothetical protein